jgi:hypothetical protein
MPIPQHDLPAHNFFLHNLVIGYARVYFWTTRTLAPFSITPIFSNSALIITTLHLKLNGNFRLFLQDYELDQDFKFFSNFFKLTFYGMSHLLTSGPFGMVFEHL